MSIGILSACVSMWGARSPGTCVIDRYELQCGCWELNWGLLEEQPLLLINHWAILPAHYFSFFSRFILLFLFMCVPVCGYAHTCTFLKRPEVLAEVKGGWLSATRCGCGTGCGSSGSPASASTHLATSPIPAFSKGPKAHVKAFWISCILPNTRPMLKPNEASVLRSSQKPFKAEM